MPNSDGAQPSCDVVVTSWHSSFALRWFAGDSCRPLDGRGKTSPFYLLGWVGGILKGLGGWQSCLVFVCLFCVHASGCAHTQALRR